MVFSKEFGSNFFDFTMRSLKEIIHDLLQKRDFEFLQKVSSWPDDRRVKAQPVIEETLKRIIKPIPKVLLIWRSGDNVEGISFGPNEKRAGIRCKDGKRKKIDPDDKNRESIFKDDNVAWVRLSSNEKIARISYKNGKGKIIDTEDGRVIFGDDNVGLISFSPNEKRAGVRYKDGERKIIDTEDGRVIFGDDNVFWIGFILNGKMAGISYKDGRRKIIDTKDGRVIFKDGNVDWMRFSSNGKMARISYKDGKGKIIDTEDGRVIFEGDNVDGMIFSPNEEKAQISYKDGRWKIIDFANYNRGIDFIKFSLEQLFFVFGLSQNPHYLDYVQDKNGAKQIWQSFCPELQQKLKKSYFPSVKFSS